MSVRNELDVAVEHEVQARDAGRREAKRLEDVLEVADAVDEEHGLVPLHAAVLGPGAARHAQVGHAPDHLEQRVDGRVEDARELLLALALGLGPVAVHQR